MEVYINMAGVTYSTEEIRQNLENNVHDMFFTETDNLRDQLYVTNIILPDLLSLSTKNNFNEVLFEKTMVALSEKPKDFLDCWLVGIAFNQNIFNKKTK